MKTRLWLLGLFAIIMLTLAGCGGGGNDDDDNTKPTDDDHDQGSLLGTCQISDGVFADTCWSYDGSPSNLSVVRSACAEQFGGAWSPTERCPTEKLLGTCVTQGGGVGEVTIYFYEGSGTSIGGADNFCVKEQSGVWNPA